MPDIIAPKNKAWYHGTCVYLFSYPLRRLLAGNTLWTGGAPSSVFFQKKHRFPHPLSPFIISYRRIDLSSFDLDHAYIRDEIVVARQFDASTIECESDFSDLRSH